MQAIALKLFPDFILIALGSFLKRVLRDDVWQGLDKLNFLVLFPALIFTSTYGKAASLRDAAAIGSGVWIIMLTGLLIAWIARSLGPEKHLDFAGLWQTAWRFNTALAFVAAQALPGESRALMSIAIGMAVPVANAFAIAALAHGYTNDRESLVLQVARNPFFIASVAGLFFSLTRVELPHLVTEPIANIAKAALPLALLSIGASIDLKALRKFNAFYVILNTTKLIVLPALTWGVTSALGVTGPVALVLTVFAALPTAAAAHVLASNYGADRGSVALVIAQSTLLGIFTLPLWIAILI
jgi:malonate transporter and related proteins